MDKHQLLRCWSPRREWKQREKEYEVMTKLFKFSKTYKHTSRLLSISRVKSESDRIKTNPCRISTALYHKCVISQPNQPFECVLIRLGRVLYKPFSHAINTAWGFIHRVCWINQMKRVACLLGPVSAIWAAAFLCVRGARAKASWALRGLQVAAHGPLGTWQSGSCAGWNAPSLTELP